MIDCETLSDRMPAVARGDARWTPEEAAHLAACEACSAEWAVVAAAARVGAGRELVRDPDALAAAVLGRVRRERRTSTARRAWIGAVGLAAAAALAGVLVFGGDPGAWGGQEASPVIAGPAAPDSPAGTTDLAVALRVPLPELEDLGVGELEAVLEAMSDTTGADIPAGQAVDELELYFDGWEG